MRIVRVTSLILGILLAVQWAFFLFFGESPEALLFHVAAELLTALVLIVTALTLRDTRFWSKYLAVFAQGMLAYIAISNSGYFLQQGLWYVPLIYLVVLIIVVLNFYLVSRTES